ncbi:MAG: hypothetical protein WBC44_16805 [Planctomycetaceae bacterium]
MSSPDPTEDTDDRFPSGPWEGYFLQRSVDGTRRKMELDLTFRDGRVSGDGRDGVGPFTLTGGYETDDGKVWWTKRYPWHEVFYRGYAETKGIWGTWEIETHDRDGFHIWPKGSRAGDEQSERREETPAVSFDDALAAEPIVTVEE